MRTVALLAFAVAACLAVEAEPGSPSAHVSFERYVAMMKTINESPLLSAEWRRHMNVFREDPLLARVRTWGTYTEPLRCAGYQAVSDQVPTSVHRLRVGDIKVIAAMGDSLTAANGADAWTALGCLTNYRGRAWSIGGDGTFTNGYSQLPNIMKQFNPNLVGYSVGKGDETSSGANLNVAVAGSIAQDMPGQAVKLVEKIRAGGQMDDWKMVTLFIGGNNLCAFCDDLEAHSAQTYAQQIELALDYLYNNLPRTFVNLVEIFDITPVADLGTGFICGLIHNSVCGCGHNASPTRKQELRGLSLEYQEAVARLVDSGKYDRREDFTVVNQPFLRETVPPYKSNGEPDYSYFAPDCFHFSSKGHNIAGKALWNNINSPVGAKATDWGENEPARCPQTPFIPTNRR